MHSIYKFLSFVPPMFLFVLPCFGQFQGKIEQIPGTDTYQVSVVSTMTFPAPQPTTVDVQISLRAAAGKFLFDNFTNVTGTWTLESPIFEPSEATDFDYFNLYLQSPTDDFDFTAGVETPLFTFTNSFSDCTYIEIVDNEDDPFLPPNSEGANIGNFINTTDPTIFDFYESNYANGYSVDCPVLGANASALLIPCPGDLTDMQVDIIGGLQPYQVAWENTGNGQNGSIGVNAFEGFTVFDDLPAGSYEITVTDKRDSTFIYELEVTDPDPVSVTLSVADASCIGSLDGQITASVTGGTVSGDYQYFWSTDPATLGGQMISSVDPGMYSVTVLDDNSCQGTQAAEVAESVDIELTGLTTDLTCFGANDGTVSVQPTAPTAPFTFAWSGNVENGGTQADIAELPAGIYEVTVTDNTGVCSATASYVVNEPQPIEVDYRLTEPQCYGDKGYLDILAVENANGAWSAEIIGKAEQILASTFEVEPGFPLRLIISDENGCEASDNFIIADKQEMYADLGPDQYIKYGETAYLDSDIFPTNGMTFEWSPTEGLTCTDCPNPAIKPTETTRYRLRMTDKDGCIVEDYVTINVEKSRDIYIPNAFSPNADGINDVFCPFGGFEITAIQTMLVFNRWGDLVYQNKEGFSVNDDLKTGWDGTARGKQLDPGTYIYTMNVEFIDGEVVLYSGEVNLMR